ncbi:threonine--tRNA ligase [Candidatus Kaiserbacteria bacterium RIFCSPHIGHO2_02_FULL_54_11b]|uniref:Threonine--tRNA ligase n=2 Tax=Candidatus Kaiseribacteriota TaxID=1752734 RepID=A0A1F6DT27_9BACT|nr:MAG: threonine--tRNA ligase [Candidatus Kaiserbacteria bacterium RIFCSPHIGHO2_02_FULL_54_11b]
MVEKNIEQIGHTLAHLTVAAVRELWPGSQNAIGPAIDNGFYQDFEIAGTITDADLPKIEAKMRELLPTWTAFEKKEVSKEEALKEFAWNKYKSELIEEFAGQGKKITFHNAPGLVDLCKGGHVENPAKEIAPDSFKLDRIAGAYWRGDEKNKMLTRIYGLAFPSKKELDAYIAQREEAKKRDHKILGKELDLFTFSELVGPGLPLWTPRGTILRNLLDDFVWELRKARGYMKVEIPHITKKELYERSGHWEKFKDELFRITTREGHEFAMKPMNCPHHIQIFARRPHSYRELPQRYANTTTCYRDEQTGELSGLSRVRAFTQDDAHVFCRFAQIKEEFNKVWDIIHTFYAAFGFDMTVRLSTHDPKHMENYLGTPENWETAVKILEQIVAEKGVNAIDGVGEAAFYGPKLDFIAHDSIGREWQVATIQLDFVQPMRFDLTCINEKNEKERVVMIHAAIMGSIDRFLSILIEHTGGVFPLWLSPVQAKILPVSEKHAVYAHEIAEQLRAADIRVEMSADDSLGKRIRAAKMEKVPYLLVVGDEEVNGKTATLEGRAGKVGALSVADIISKLKEEIRTRA